MLWQNESQIGAPPHNQNPYAFKVYGFRKAEQAGHRFVVWLDASVWAIRDVTLSGVSTLQDAVRETLRHLGDNARRLG